MIKENPNCAQSDKKSMILTFIFSFAVLSVIMYCAPLVADDYVFLSYKFSNLKEAVMLALCYGNGRFFGNLGVIFLVRSTLLSVVYKSLILSLIIVLIPKVMKISSKYSYPISFLLVMSVPPKVFAQVYSWTSGFQNYVPPVLILIICVMLFQNQSSSRSINVLKTIVIIILGFCGQLFVEHNTAINIIVALCAVFYAFIKLKNNRIMSISWFISTVVGAAAMVLIPKFFKGENTQDMSAYRSFKLDSLSSLLYSVRVNSYGVIRFLATNTLMLLFIALLSFVLLRAAKGSFKYKTFYSLLQVSNMMLAALCVLRYFVMLDTEYKSFMKYINNYIFVPIFLLYFIFAVAVLKIKETNVKIPALFCAALAVIAAGALLVVDPISWRNIFLSDMLLIAGILKVFDYAVKSVDDKKMRAADCALKSTAVVLSCALITVFLNIKWFDNYRTDYIQSEVKKGNQNIEVFFIPSDYDAYGDWDYFSYIYYNEKRGDITFTQVDYDKWIETHEFE